MGQVVRASMPVCYSQAGMFGILLENYPRGIVCATEAIHNINY